MIRFCDKDVLCVEQNRINRSELLKYFLNGNLDEIVCVVDSDNKYIGHIIYRKLIQNERAEDAVIKDYLVFDKEIWKNARMLFAIYKAELGGELLFPVLDTNRHLFCFAYEDGDANRELRMLRELQGKPSALRFLDIYPKIQCVRICEFNELAYFFAKYLKVQKVPVQVEGSMWESFIESDKRDYLDYSYLTIYAEGTWEKPFYWMENLMRSVSVEFECIDHIYEENMRAGVIKNADRSRIDFFKYLREADEIVLLGTDIAALDAYDYLKKMGIEICCFVSDRYDERGNKLFGKKILRTIEAMEKYRQAVFIDVHEKRSAWGMGRTDEFDYMGYERNKNFFLLNDYVDIEGDSLRTALKDQEVVLTGDIWLCERLADYFERLALFNKDQLIYIALSDEIREEESRFRKEKTENLKKDALCLIVMPEYYEKPDVYEAQKQNIRTCLAERGFVNSIDYFSYAAAFIKIETELKKEMEDTVRHPKRVVIGSIEPLSGNTFFEGLLDSHPSIVMMDDMCYLNMQLFWFCIRLAGRRGGEIVSLWKQIYYCEQRERKIEGQAFLNIDHFGEKLGCLLEPEKIYTSQELFILFHRAYMYMNGMKTENIEDCMIYWEPHHMPRTVLEEHVKWLGTENMPCDIINVVRNSFMRNGSHIKGCLEMNWGRKAHVCQIAVRCPKMNDKGYHYCKRLIVRFEDLKLSPREKLQKLCEEWEIPWSETLMQTTKNGKKKVYNNGRKEIKDFDLTPVYNAYDEYFSEFDKFRISILCLPWQKSYGYPYVDLMNFSRKELQELFLKSFRIMDKLCFDSEKTRFFFFYNWQRSIRMKLWQVRSIREKAELSDLII